MARTGVDDGNLVFERSPREKIGVAFCPLCVTDGHADNMSGTSGPS
jgi:hypothetical protein